MKAKVINKTQWETSGLKKLTHKVIKKMGAEGVTRIVTFVTGKSREQYYKKDKYKLKFPVHGVASYTLGWIKMKIPDKIKTYMVGESGHVHNQLDVDVLTPDYCKTIAQVLEHEVGHNLGLHHSDMGHWKNINTDYLGDMVIQKKQIKEKPKRNLKDERYKKAKSKITEYTSKIKRYNNLLKKWGKKVKYYERAD